MTFWDFIHRQGKQEQKIRTIEHESYFPFLKKFLEQSEFNVKSALDLGCGEGQALKMLRSFGFKADGIDSSEVAVELAKKTLGDAKDSVILCSDMFGSEIIKNKYDLIVSLSAIYHAEKKQIENLVDKIFDALMENGKVFITLPDLDSAEQWDNFKNYQEVSAGVFVPIAGNEKGIPHSFYKKEEAQKIFSKFPRLKIENDGSGYWIVEAEK